MALDRVVATDPTVVTFNQSAGTVWGYAVRDSTNVPYLAVFQTARRQSARPGRCRNTRSRHPRSNFPREACGAGSPGAAPHRAGKIANAELARRAGPVHFGGGCGSASTDVIVARSLCSGIRRGEEFVVSSSIAVWGRAVLVIVVGAAVGLGVVGSPAVADVPATGAQIKAAHSDKCLNVEKNSLANNAAIVQYTCGDSFPNDKFRVVPVGAAGAYQIVATSSGKCLNVKGALVANDTPVVQYTCVEAALNNLWTFVPVVGKPTFRIVSKQSGKCLNVSKGVLTNSAPLVLYGCTTSANNDQFYFPPAASAVPTPLPVTANTPVVAVQAGVDRTGSLVYAFTDNVGRMWNAIQDPDNLSTVVYPPSGDLNAYAGPPQINVRADGQTQVAARNTVDGDLWLTVDEPVDVGGAGAGQPALGRLPNGNLVVLAVANGALWALPQDGTNVPYAGWRKVGGTDLTGEPTVVTVANGIRVFVSTTSGTVQTAIYDGSLSGLTSLGTEQFTGKTAAMVLPGSKSRVVARNAVGQLFTKLVTDTGTSEPAWTPVGDFVAAGPPAVVLDDWLGVAAVVARGEDGLVYYTLETAQASGEWKPWGVALDRVVATDPTVVTFNQSAGTVWGYAVRDST
ncbi:MAG TPA: RICIN domain-containing protein, partial [Actinoplanes sp.]